LRKRHPQLLAESVRALGFALWALAALASSPSRAETPTFHADSGRRIAVNAMEYPWSAIGRLNTGGKGFCTGVLIAESAVLTAAHCLYDSRSNRLWSAAEIHFVAGYQREQFLIHSPVARITLADDFAIAGQPAITPSSADWAIVQLRQPIGRQAGYLGLEWLDREALARMQRQKAIFLQAGYRGDWPHAITVDLDCAIRSFVSESSSVAHDCQAVRGDSGSPLLAIVGGDIRIVGLVSMLSESKRLAMNGGNGIAWGVAVATSALRDARARPAASQALEKAGARWGAGHPPMAGGPAAALPLTTIRLLLQGQGHALALGDSGNDQAGLGAAIRSFQQAHGLSPTGQPSLDLLGPLIGAARPGRGVN